MKGCSTTKLLPEHGPITRGRMARPPGQGAAPDGHRQDHVQGRLEAPPVRDGHRPTRDRRACRHLRERQVLPGPQDHPGRDRRVPRQGHGSHHRHAPAADARAIPGRRHRSRPKRSPWTRSDPDHVVGTGTPGELHRRGGRGRRRQGRDHHVRLRSRPGHDPDDRDRQGLQRQARCRPRRGRPRHARRPGRSPDPVPEHLRPGAGLDDRSLPGPGPPRPDRAAPRLRQRQGRRARPRWTAVARSSSAAGGSG